ncbi:MAG: polyprenol phosphomannose-dependent alpha 1,6 mannosyltransferase MptB [Solirubrobacteraceae bacterium]
MTVNAPLGATAEGGSFEVTATATLVQPAHTLRRPQTRTRAERIGIGATFAVPVLGLFVCIAGTRTQALLPQPIQLAAQASGMTGPLTYLGFHLTVGEIVAALLVLLGVYLVAMWYAEHVPQRLIVGSVIAFTVIAMIGPPLFSTDVFSYQAYAKMFAHYHMNPYLFGPEKIGGYPLPNPLASYIGAKWINTPSVYGPLFTFLSVPLQSTSITFNYYAFKVIAALASGTTMCLIWKSAERRGVSPKRGVALFGLSPLVTMYGVGGGHNDLLMLMLTTGGIYALLDRRERAAGSLIAAGTAVKLTGAIVLPFALIGEGARLDLRRRWGRMLSAIVALSAAIAAASYIAFGTGIMHTLHTLQSVQDQGDWQSLPGIVFQLSHAKVTHLVRTVDDVVLVGIVLWLLRRVWQGRMDWIEGAAWATFAVLATAWSLLPWYSAWMLPLVALSASRRLWYAATAATLMGGAIMIAGCFPSWNWL